MASYSLLTVAATVLASALAKTVPANNVTLTTRACQPPYNTYPFCDNTLSLDTRLKDLISRVNQNEIPSLITARHYTPTTNNNISRLGIPEFDWGMNAIHGVQSTCIELPDGTVRCPTSWPNPVNYGKCNTASVPVRMTELVQPVQSASPLQRCSPTSCWLALQG